MSSPFVCDMNAFTPAERSEHIAAIRSLFRLVQEVRELPDGYAFRLPSEADLLTKSAEFIAKERLCCPFFGFKLELEPEGGALWLHLTGSEGVKPFILAEVGGELPAGLVG